MDLNQHPARTAGHMRGALWEASSAENNLESQIVLLLAVDSPWVAYSPGTGIEPDTKFAMAYAALKAPCSIEPPPIKSTNFRVLEEYRLCDENKEPSKRNSNQ